MPPEWPYITGYSLSTWLKKNTVNILKQSHNKNRKQWYWIQRNYTLPTSYYNIVGGSISKWRVTYIMTTLMGMIHTLRLGRILCIFLPITISQPFQEIVNHKETRFPRKPVTEGILKYMTRPIRKIKSAKIFSKMLSIFSLSKATSPSTVKKVNPVFKTWPKIWRKLRRPSPPYKQR